MEAMVTTARLPRRWSLGKNYATTAAIISFLVVAAPSLYNSDLLIFLAMGLLALLLALGIFASILCLKNLSYRQWRRAGAWLLLAGFNFTGWWVNYRIGTEAMQLPLSPDGPALGDLLRWAFAPYFSS
jgi:uncharacterized membrane protein YhaH (DUF805 family)